MKNKNHLTAKLIAGGLLTGLTSYVIAKYSNNFHLQILPLCVYPIAVLIFFTKYLRNIPETKGTWMIFGSQITALASLYFLLVLIPLPGVSRTKDFSMLSLIFLALIGISLLISLMLRIFIYYKLHNHDNMHQPLHQ